MPIRLVALAILLASVAWGQSQPPSSDKPSATPAEQSMPGMDMPVMHHGMPAANDKEDSEAGAHVMHSMEGHMDMGPHMKMTAPRLPKPGDAERAQKVVNEAREAAEKYKDYHTALAEGFKIFLPNVPQKVYHFTNRAFAIEAELRFNPDHPTSLLYEKHGDDYALVGVMYTAPKKYTEDQLDERIPLSIGQWHEHVNFCIPPMGKWREMSSANPQFGLRGSITSQEACDAAGGSFPPSRLQLDGACVSIRKGPSEHLVGRTTAR